MTRNWTSIAFAALALVATTAATAQQAPAPPPADPSTETTETDAPADASATGAAADTGPTTLVMGLACSEINDLGEAHAAALVYYIAGYADALADADDTSVPDFDMPGGLTLSAAAVIEACDEAPGQLVAEAVKGLGGSRADRSATTAPANADDAMAPAEETPDETDAETAPQ